MPEADSCRNIITSEDTVDFLIQYNGELNRAIEQYDPVCTQRVNPKYAIMHYYYNELQTLRYSNSIFPKLYGPASVGALEAGCILRLRRQPTLSLYGSGVIIGLVDTGIDYLNKLFLQTDRTSRILSIWDQSDQTGNLPNDFEYGSEYTRDQIDEAIASADPYEIVPERDTVGHGTSMAALAAGNEDTASNFSGAAPLSDIVMVKLKPAKQNLRDYYFVNDSAVCYQENDILMGFKYLLRAAMIYNRPIVMCFGLVTNSGGHDGSGILDEYLNSLGNYNGICIVTAGGNEGNSAGHFRGSFYSGSIGFGSQSDISSSPNSVNLITSAPLAQSSVLEPGFEKSRVTQERYITAELNVGEGETGFMLELWSRTTFTYSMNIISPGGRTALIQGTSDRSEILNFAAEATTIFADYHEFETRTGDSFLALRFDSPSAGIWQLQIIDNSGTGGLFDIWLPLRSFLNSNTYFLRPDPDITICGPGNCSVPITVTAYNYRTEGLWLQSSRGFSRNNNVTPDIAAPGVDIIVPIREELALADGSTNEVYLETGFSGTSLSSAITAGAACLLLEWGIVRGNRQVMSSTTIRRMFYQGAVPKGLSVPNREWGYGVLCASNSLPG